MSDKPLLIQFSSDVRIGAAKDAPVFTGSISVLNRNKVFATEVSLKSKEDRGITITRLIESLSGDTVSLPAFIDNLAIRKFLVRYESGESSGAFRLEFESRITINAKYFDASLTYSYSGKAGNKTSRFTGTINIDAHQFALSFSGSGDTATLTACYQQEPGTATTISLKSVLRNLGMNAEEVPDLSIQLNDFSALLVYNRKQGQSRMLFGMGAGLGKQFNLSQLPLVGSIIEEKQAFNIENISVYYSVAAFTAEEVTLLKDDNPNLPLPLQRIEKGFSLFIRIANGDRKTDYYLQPSLKAAEAKPELTTGSDAAAEGKKDTSALAVQRQDGVKWFDLNYKTGPFTFQKVGIAYRNKQLVFLIDALCSLSAIDLQLMGLGFGFKLQWPPEMPPDFYLDGMGLSYKKDPLEISGSFVRVRGEDPSVLEFYGGAKLKLSAFSIAAIGAYAQRKIPGNGQTPASTQHSLFIYGAYFGAIGGPPFFFVNGLAAGFGYNRSIRIPKIDEVQDFPLVSLVLSGDKNKTIGSVLQDLISKQWIPESAGDYWFAVGVRFSTFKIIDSFVLLIAQFGNRMEFTILGLSILAWPDKAFPIAYVELAIKISYSPGSDLIAVEAMLTSNSFLFDKNCRLTGGFAFYVWVSGANKGDFVITLGGYHPAFIVPVHYPKVERLGLNWKLSNKLTIKGGVYFALTPGYIMAGGGLEVAFDIGFLKASIKTWLDMIIGWAPFRYRAGIGIVVSIQANIDFGLFTTQFNVVLSARMEIWGPPFAGIVEVNWKIFSFTISFGDVPDEEAKPLGWKEFQKQFLPAATEEDKILFPAADITVTSGIIKEHKVGNTSYLIVNPLTLQVKIEAPVPLTMAAIAKTIQHPAPADIEELNGMTTVVAGTKTITYDQINTRLGIRPTGDTYLDSRLLVSMNGLSLEQLDTTGFSTGMPEALWSPEKPLSGNSKPTAPKILPDVLKGIMLAPLKPGVPEGTPQLDLSNKFVVKTKTLRWTFTPVKLGFDNNKVTGSIKDAIIGFMNDSTTRALNTALLEEATGIQGLAYTTQNNNDERQWVGGLNGAPVIAETGSYPQYK